MEQCQIQEQKNDLDFDVSYLREVPVEYQEGLVEKGVLGQTAYARFTDGRITNPRIAFDDYFSGNGENIYDVIDNALQKKNYQFLEIALHEAYHVVDAFEHISGNSKKQKEGFAVVNSKLSTKYAKFLKQFGYSPSAEDIFEIPNQIMPYLLEQTRKELLEERKYLPSSVREVYVDSALDIIAEYSSKCR